MALTFDGVSKLITLTSGTTVLDVKDLYSRWKDWVQQSDNAKFLPAFAPIGGDPIDAVAGTFIPLYAFLANGWRLRPQEADHTLNVTGGILLVQGGGDPFLTTLGDFTVRVNYSQPVQAITVSTGAGGGLTSDQHNMLAALFRIHGLETGVPLVVTPTSRAAGAIVQTVTEAAGTVTVARS